MIKDLFIPEKVGTYYISTKRIVGFETTKTAVYACQVSAHGKVLTVEKLFSEPLPKQGNREDNIKEAINKILSQLKFSYDIHTCISSSHAIFKTLHLPFSNRSKIEKVITYEVEPALPFSLKSARIDFIITHINPELFSSDVLVTAVQKKYIEESVAPFISLGKDPDLLTVDMIALYQLYKRIPDYNSEGITILLDLRPHETRLVYISDGQLKLIRTLSKGLSDYLIATSKQLNIKQEQLVADLINPSSEVILQSIDQIMDPFWKDIAFTISSFKSQVSTAKETKILLLGEGSEVKDIAKVFYKKLTIPTDYFELNRLFHVKEIVSKIKGAIPQKNYISLATALPPLESNGFNLYKYFIASPTTVYKQLVTTLVLSVAIVGSLLLFNIVQVRKFKKELNTSITETMNSITKIFGRDLQPKTVKQPLKALQRMVQEAERKSLAKEKLWFAFSAPAQVTFSRYLYELFTGLDPESLGLVVSRLDLKEGIVLLEGRVRDYDALAQFDKFIQSSPLFGRIVRGSLQEPEFSIDIELNKNGDET